MAKHVNTSNLTPVLTEPTKEAKVPAKEIDLAIERKSLFESDPERYRYEE